MLGLGLWLAQVNLSHATDHSDKASIRLSMLDVGQGDSYLLTCQDAKTHILVDAGDSSENYPGVSEKLIKDLKKRIDFSDSPEFIWINTHAHPDHILGYFTVLEKFPNLKIKRFYQTYPGAKLSKKLAERLIGLNVSPKNLYEGLTTKSRVKTFFPCEGVKVSFFLPSKSQAKSLKCPKNLNDCSQILRIDFAGRKVLLLADVTTTWEKTMLSDKVLQDFLEADIMSLGHHGNHSTSIKLLETTCPKYFLLSTGKAGVGKTSFYGYPRVDVLERLASSKWRGCEQDPKVNSSLHNFRFVREKAVPDKEKWQLKACSKNNELDKTCKWSNFEIPELYATTRDGTVDIFWP